MQNKKESFLVFLFAGFCLCLLVAHLFFLPLSEHTDSLSLFNPVYMMKYYHRIAYPIYSYFDNMPVHPPLHYLVTGLIYLVGGNLHTAIILPTLLIGIVLLLIVMQASFSMERKLAILCSIASIITIAEIIVRPDFTLSIWWFSGLLLLEDGRERNWNLKRLALGSFMLGMSTCMHYLASFAFLGVLIYAYQLRREQANDFFKNKRLYALIAPALTVVTCYLLLQVIPNFRDIYKQVHGNSSDGNIIRSLQVHWLHFHYPPPALLALVLFFIVWRKSLLHVASLPLTLFVLLYSTMKSGGYYSPELFVFYTGCYLVFFTVVYKIPVHINFKYAFTLLFLLLFCKSLWPLRHLVLQRESELVTARASAQYLFGANKGIATRMDLWYVCGADRSYNMEPDLFWKNDISNVDCKKYFNQFDLVAEHSHLSARSYTRQQMTISDWYLDSTLSLAGFYLTNNNNPHFWEGLPLGNVISFMLFSPNDTPSFRGIQCIDNEELFLYEKTNHDARYFFFSTILDKNTDLNTVSSCMLECSSFALSSKSNHNTRAFPNDVKHYLFWGIINADSLSVWNAWTLKHNVSYRDFIALQRKQLNKEELLRQLHENDKPIKFYNSIENWRAGKPYYN